MLRFRAFNYRNFPLNNTLHKANKCRERLPNESKPDVCWSSSSKWFGVMPAETFPNLYDSGCLACGRRARVWFQCPLAAAGVRSDPKFWIRTSHSKPTLQFGWYMLRLNSPQEMQIRAFSVCSFGNPAKLTQRVDHTVMFDKLLNRSGSKSSESVSERYVMQAACLIAAWTGVMSSETSCR